MLFQVDETKELFVASEHYRHTVISIIDLMEVEETVPEFMKRVGLTKYLTAFNTCEQIKITETDEKHYSSLRESIHVVKESMGVGYIQDLDDGEVRVFIKTNHDKYFYFDMLFDNEYLDVSETVKMFDDIRELIVQETLLWNM